jgi:hypothetical protein
MGVALRIILPRNLTTGVKRWRFQGTKLRPELFHDYFAAGPGGAAAGAGAALPDVVDGAGG